MILKYNHAVALYHAGKKSRALEAVNALFMNQEVVFDYVVIKISCLCLVRIICEIAKEIMGLIRNSL